MNSFKISISVFVVVLSICFFSQKDAEARDCRVVFRTPEPGVFLKLTERFPPNKSWLMAPGELTTDRVLDPLMRDYYFTEEQVRVDWLRRNFEKTVRFFDWGSGFLISPKGHVVTAAHVLASVREITKQNPQAKDLMLIVNHRFVSLKGARIVFDGWSPRRGQSKSDLAVLEIPALAGMPYFEISNRAPVVGEPLATFGAPKFIGGQKVLSIGEVLDPKKLRDTPDLVASGAFEEGLIFSNLQTHTSSSGGVVISLRDGKVVGIHVESLKPYENLPISVVSMAEPVGKLKPAMEWE